MKLHTEVDADTLAESIVEGAESLDEVIALVKYLDQHTDNDRVRSELLQYFKTVNKK